MLRKSYTEQIEIIINNTVVYYYYSHECQNVFNLAGTLSWRSSRVIRLCSVQ